MDLFIIIMLSMPDIAKLQPFSYLAIAMSKMFNHVMIITTHSYVRTHGLAALAIL